ncbi:MAG: MaoC family dehydratase N-terminal domain-containing protein [Dehalococcoidia bacterium]|nr:MaoC family dehydratase N-terminal domain-containing protein [Dehalococcoidia bacterium]
MTTRENQPVAQSARGDSRYTWQDAIAAIGQDFASGEEQVADEAIEHTTVMRFCEVWEIGNPIYWHEDVAKQAGYRNVVVPWSAIKQTFAYNGFWRPGAPTRFPPNLDKNASAQTGSFEVRGRPIPTPPFSTGVFTDMEIEYFEPVCVGDRLTVKGNKLINVRPRKTRIGDGAFINRGNEIYNQKGELVARVNQGGYRYNPTRGGGQ